jgi:hypothetical protein
MLHERTRRQEEEMNTRTQKLLRMLVGTTVLSTAAILGLGVVKASAGEIIPSVGLSRPVHSSSDETNLFGGLAIRGNLGPAFKAEIGAAYREEEVNNNFMIRQWPLTASLWLTPIPQIYAGGGVGWYHTSYDYNDDAFDFQNETTQEFGVHLGGGLSIPMTPSLGLDLNGRYVFLEDIEDKISTEKVDPDFWSTTLGLAIRF